MNLPLWLFIFLVICSAIGIVWSLSLFIIFVSEISKKLNAKRLKAKLIKKENDDLLKELRKTYFSLLDKVNDHEVVLRTLWKGRKSK